MAEKPRVVRLQRQSGHDEVKQLLEGAAEALPPTTVAGLVIVSTREGNTFPVFQGRSDALLWMLEVARLELMMGAEPDGGGDG